MKEHHKLDILDSEALLQRARLLIAVEVLAKEANRRSESHDKNADVLFKARDILYQQVIDTLPPGDDDK